MLKQLLLVVAVLAGPQAQAQDKRAHLDQMAQPELCVYKAKLAAAGAWIRIHKHATSCNTIKYLWHDDETEFEIDVVKQATCYGFESGVDPISAGDNMYLDCMAEKHL